MKEAGRLRFGQVPIISIDGKVYTQTAVCNRFCAEVAGLYPLNDKHVMWAIEEVGGILQDVYMELFSIHGKNPEECKEVRRNTAETTFPRFLGGLNDLANERATNDVWYVGESITLADLWIYCLFDDVCSGVFKELSAEDVKPFSRLMKIYEGVRDHPKVVAWNESHPPADIQY